MVLNLLIPIIVQFMILCYNEMENEKNYAD